MDPSLNSADREGRLDAVLAEFLLAVDAGGTPDPGPIMAADPDLAGDLADFKAYASRTLNRCYGQPPSETWWTSNGSKRKLRNDQALADAINYVLYNQPYPLVIWSPELGRLV